MVTDDRTAKAVDATISKVAHVDPNQMAELGTDPGNQYSPMRDDGQPSYLSCILKRQGVPGVAITTAPEAVHSRVARQLEKAVGPHRYNLWFRTTTMFELEDHTDTLRVAVPNQFIADRVDRSFKRELDQAATDAIGKPVSLEITVDPSRFDRVVSMDQSASEVKVVDAAPSKPNTTADISAITTPRPYNKRPNTSALNLRYSLDDFIVGPSNKLAFAAATQYAIEPNEHVNNPLFIVSDCGLGKTHLLQGICRKFQQVNPAADVRYLTAEQFTNEYIQAVRNKRLDGFRRKMRSLDLLAIDDVHFLAGKDKTQSEFQHCFDALEVGRGRVVLSATVAPREMENIQPSLVNRFSRGMMVRIDEPDTETRVQIVRELAAKRGISLLETVLAVVASRCRGSVRELEGTLTKLHALARLEESADTQAEAESSQQIIGHRLINRLFDMNQAASRPIRFQDILDAVCSKLNIRHEQVFGRSRQQDIVLARGLIAHLSRDLTSMSYPEVGHAMHRTSHSTVVTADKRLKRQISQRERVSYPTEQGRHEADLSSLVEDLKADIRKRAV